MAPKPSASPIGERQASVPLPWWRRWRTQLLATFLLLALACGSITGLDTWRAVRAAEDGAQAAQAEAARTFASALRLLMGRYQVTATVLAGALLPRPLPARDRREWLEAVQTALPEAAVLVTDGSGHVTDASHAGAVGTDVSGRDYFRRLAAGEPSVVMDLAAGGVSAEPEVGAAAAARAADGSLLGTVAVGVPAHALAREIGPLVPGGSYPVVVDRNGRAVVPGSDALADRSPPGPLVPVPELGWAVGLLRPLERGQAAAPGGPGRSLASLLAVAALALALAVVSSGRLARPLTALSRGVAALQRGEFAHRVHVAGSDEFGALAESFNRMAADLAAYVAALRESEERFRVAQELSLDGFAILRAVRDGSGAIVDFTWAYVNPAAARILRLPADRLAGRRLLEVLPSNRETILPAYARVVETGEPHDLEVWYQADGLEGWFRNMAVRAGDGVAVSFRDITERKRAEAALRESEERLRLAIQAAKMVPYTWDIPADRVRIGSDRPGSSTAGSTAEVTSSYGAKLARVHPDDRERLQSDLAAALKSGLYESEHREVRGDGSERWILDRGRVEFDERGAPARLLGVWLDITDRKRAEAERSDLLARERWARAEAEAARAEALAATAELARSNEALQQRLIQIQALLEVSPVGIGMAEDPEGRCVLANPALGRMLGVEPWSNISTAAAPGRSLPFTFLRDGRPLEADELPLRRALAQGMPVGDTEVEVVTGDGRRLHLLEWATPFLDAQGRVRGGFLAVVDITERTRAERSLRFLAEASAILASSLDSEATVGLITRLAVPAVADWCFVDLVAGASTRRVGLAHTDPTRAEVSAALQGFVPGRDGAHPVAAVLASGRSQLLAEVDDARLRAMAAQDEAHYRALRALAPGSWLTVPLTARERPLGALTLIAAESGRRYGEADVALAEELARRVAAAIDNARLYREAQEAVRVRELFFAAASHELRTPLTSAVGALRLVKRAMAGQLREAPESLIDLANRSLDAMLVLLNDLLDATRLSARPDALAREPVPLGPLVASALDLVAPQARENGVAIDLAVPAGLTAAGDPERLEQVIVNLLANAVRHSRAGGTVRVEGGTAGGDVVLRVRDEGDGIAPDDLERVFEPFVRAHPHRGARKGGTGLGLTICRQIVTLHEGRIWAESEGAGRGSTFVVTLPGVPAGRRAA